MDENIRASKPAVNWIRKLSAYKEPSTLRSVVEILLTLPAFLALWGLAVWVSSVSYFLTVPICVLAAAFLVRLFLIQHDCSHGAFFKSKAANDWTGRAIGILTITPYDLWQRSHIIHHGAHGNLDKRGIGDILTLTVEEYNSRSKWKRFTYRLYRNPFVLFAVGPIFVFMLHHRLPVGFMKSGAKYWISTMGTNVAIAVILIAGMYTMGWLPFLVTYLSITGIGAMMGVWLFYVQHQFEDTVWEAGEDWKLHEAALYGSSYYVMPKVLQWMTANIGIHHVHHLYSKIPYYRLSKVLKDFPELAQTRRLTMIESFKTPRLKLWDTHARRMVSFKTAKLRRV